MSSPHRFGVGSAINPLPLPNSPPSRSPALAAPQNQTRDMGQNEMPTNPDHARGHEQRPSMGELSQSFRESQAPEYSSGTNMSPYDYLLAPDHGHDNDYPKGIKQISEHHSDIMDAFHGGESDMDQSTDPDFRESPTSSTPVSLPSSTTTAVNPAQGQTVSTISGGSTTRASTYWSDEELNVLMTLVDQNTSPNTGLTTWDPVYRGFRARFPGHNRKDRGLQMKVWRTWKENGQARRPNYQRG